MAQRDEGQEAPGAAPQVLTFGSPSVGEVLAERYQLDEHIGNDSLGRQLYRGIDVILRRPVAVVLRYPGGESASEMLAGAVAASRIVHPHLVGVYDAIDEADRAYVVREWVDGVALRDLAADEPLDPHRSVVIAWAVTDAVAALHATGMAHGNIHPGTVLVANDGRVVLTDARADEAATPEADLRAIGAVLYCALTGYWPHREAGPTTVPDAPRDGTGALPAPRQVRAGVPTHLDQLTSNLLNPDLPLPAADALGTELARFNQGDESDYAEHEHGELGHGLSFASFDGVTSAPPQTRASSGRKLAIGVAGLLVLALAGTIAAAQALGGSGNEAAPSNGPASGTSAQAKKPAGQPTVLSIPRDKVRVVAPKGGRDDEFKNVDRVVDGTKEGWRTQWYLGSANFGNLKPGLGVWLDLGGPQRVANVEVQLSRAGATGELKVGDSDPGSTSEGDTQLVADYKTVGEPAEMQTKYLFGGPDQEVRYILLWITKLPKIDDNKYQLTVEEITVRVQ